MPESRSPAALCRELSSELREMGEWLTTGRLSAEQFRVAMLTLEAEKVRRFGFTLTAERSPQGRVHFELRYVGTGKICSCMDFDSASQRLCIDHLAG